MFHYGEKILHDKFSENSFMYQALLLLFHVQNSPMYEVQLLTTFYRRGNKISGWVTHITAKTKPVCCSKQHNILLPTVLSSTVLCN